MSLMDLVLTAWFFFLTILIFQFPNGLGLILGAMQLALYAYYSRKWRGQDSSAPLLLAWSKPEWMIDRSAGFAMVWILERVGLWWIVQFWLSLHMLVLEAVLQTAFFEHVGKFCTPGGQMMDFFLIWFPPFPWILGVQNYFSDAHWASLLVINYDMSHMYKLRW